MRPPRTRRRAPDESTPLLIALTEHTVALPTRINPAPAEAARRGFLVLGPNRPSPGCPSPAFERAEREAGADRGQTATRKQTESSDELDVSIPVSWSEKRAAPGERRKRCARIIIRVSVGRVPPPASRSPARIPTQRTRSVAGR